MKNENKAFLRKLTRKLTRKTTEEKAGSQASRRKGIPNLMKFLATTNKEINNFLKDIKIKQKEKQMEEFSKKRLEVLFKFIFYIFSNIMNIISVFMYMLQTFFPEDNPENQAITLGLSYIELTLTFYFLLEYILLGYRLKGGYFKHLISIDSFIDIITIVPSIVAYFISFRGVRLSFIRIFRIFRVFRVLRIYKSLRRIQNETAEDNSEDGPQGKSLKFDPIKLQFFTIVVILVCVFFIGAGLVLGMNDLIENAFSKKNFNFLDAIYFMIVTFSTLGYGDITPSNVTTRFMIIIGLFCLIIIVSDQMTKLANLLKFWGPGISAFHGQNHIIMIADKTINVDMLINFLASRIPVKRDFIIISKDIPPYSYTFYPYNKTVVINTQNIDLELLDLINFKAASGIFIFSSKCLNNYEQYDKITDFFLMKLTQNFFQSNIYIQSLNTEKTLLNVVLSDKKKHTPCYQNLKKVVPIWKMKSLMIAKSSFNPGFNTFIQNLLFNYTPRPLNVLEYSEIIQHYIHGTENKMLVCKLSEFFKGKDFYDVMYMIYFKSISEYFYKINTETNLIRVYLLIGVYEKNIIDRYTDDDIEIFPYNYEITNNSCGIFIGPFNEKKKLEEMMNEFDIFDSESEVQKINEGAYSEEKISKKHFPTPNLNGFRVNKENSGNPNQKFCNREKNNISEKESNTENSLTTNNGIINKRGNESSISNNDSSNVSITSLSCNWKSSNNSDSSSNDKSNDNVLRNLNRRVSDKKFLSKRSDSLNILNITKKIKNKKSNKKDIDRNRKLLQENIKNGNINYRKKFDRIFDSNIHLNQNTDKIKKNYKRSSSSIDKTKQSENFKQSNNGNPIIKKYKSSSIDSNNIKIKNLYNSDKINLEMKINICNQDRYFKSGNLNINLNLNTFLNNNNFSKIAENLEENREDSAHFYKKMEQDKTFSMNDISKHTQKTNSFEIDSSVYRKKSDFVININNNENNFSSDSLNLSKDKNKNSENTNEIENFKEKDSINITKNDNRKNRIKISKDSGCFVNNRNKSTKKVSFKGENESCSKNRFQMNLDENPNESLKNDRNNILILNENQSNNKVFDKLKDLVPFSDQIKRKKANSKSEKEQDRKDIKTFQDPKSINLCSKEIKRNKPETRKQSRKTSKLEMTPNRDPFPKEKKISIRNSKNFLQNYRGFSECSKLSVKEYKNKNTILNLELLNKIDNEVVYAFSNDTLDDLAKKYYSKNLEEEKDSVKALEGENLIEHKIYDVEKTNYSSFFRDHIVIVGYQDNLYKLLKFLFCHHRRDICLITRYDYEDSKIVKLLKQYKNLFYLKGQADNPMNLINAGMNNAFMVIFLTEKLYRKTNEDMDNILIYRTVDYFFDTEILIEVWDNKNTKFLGYMPLIEDGKTEKNEFLHPCFMAGRCIYSGHLDSIIANSYLNDIGTNAWMKLLNLGVNTKGRYKRNLEKRRNSDKNNEQQNCSPVILTIDIPVQYSEKEYYILVDDLMKLEPPALALGIYVTQPLDYVSIKSQGKIKSNKNNKNGDNIDIFTSHKKKLVNKEEMEKNDQGYQGKLKIMREISYNDKVVLDIMDLNKTYLPIFITNPGPDFIIANNCKVMILYHVNGENKNLIYNESGKTWKENANVDNIFNSNNPNNIIPNKNNSTSYLENGIQNTNLLRNQRNLNRKESVFDLYKMKKDNLKNKQEKILMFYEILKKKIMNTINEKYVSLDDDTNINAKGFEKNKN